MSASYLFPMGALVLPLMQFGLVLCSVFAAILFFKSDRRMHTWILLVGSIGGALSASVTTAELNSFNFISYYSSYRPEHANSFPYGSFAITPGLDLIFGGMVAYGLVSTALIQYRNSKATDIDPLEPTK